ncbi:DNA topoisomerase 3 [Vibrio aerogenes CECT 7868]|uniref:DNA topoisomerase 3 n=1 Tax=Vibrio aerogenes CECT 7868 TaxID=1216006 RepID=A0A1M6CXP6_9VIBR|nr:DNA topoisomerase III [Vibrio aerogenes]SHI65574.1 DNA topoisomerase 3 [Vibrio aerogenes CECT 7868]
MSRLFIAEKPGLGRAIAAVLPSPHHRDSGFIRCGNGDIVTWCIGHLLEQVEPDAYDERYKKWRLEDLPIVPDKWQLKPRKSSAQQLKVIRKLLQSHQHIIHAGDPDREGQLLVDEVIDHCRVSQVVKSTVERLLINDLNPAAVKKALQQMRPNREFIALSVSALARSRADWLYGMNMSRAYTLLGQRSGYQGVLSVGRVQTPVLGLVVRRDEQIENFVSKDYFTLDALIPYHSEKGTLDIRARWKPSEACEPWLDEERRLLHLPLAENVARRIAGQPAVVTESEQKQTRHSPPLPYSLSALQIDASRRYSMNAQQVLQVCQSLYEKHKLITYPRSDCRYLPVEHQKDIHQVIQAISATDPELQSVINHADLSIRTKAWNDKKVEAHHAIIPTPKQGNNTRLSSDERKIYQLVATQYLLQFYPPAVYAGSKLVFEIAGGVFIASGKQLIDSGWKQVTGHKEESVDICDIVPPLEKGCQLICREGEIKSHKTEPPKPFSEATLLQAMTGIARFIEDKKLKKILRETDGLGTEATRAGIIDILMKRQLLTRRGKTIHGTAAGRGLIHALPTEATLPDMTAHWEHQLQDIAEKKQPYQPFMHSLAEQVTALMNKVQSSPLPDSLKSMPQNYQKQKRRRTFKKRKSQGKKVSKGSDG